MTGLLDTVLDRLVVPGYTKIGYLRAPRGWAGRRPASRRR